MTNLLFLWKPSYFDNNTDKSQQSLDIMFFIIFFTSKAFNKSSRFQMLSLFLFF